MRIESAIESIVELRARRGCGPRTYCIHPRLPDFFLTLTTLLARYCDEYLPAAPGRIWKTRVSRGSGLPLALLMEAEFWSTRNSVTGLLELG